MTLTPDALVVAPLSYGSIAGRTLCLASELEALLALTCDVRELLPGCASHGLQVREYFRPGQQPSLHASPSRKARELVAACHLVALTRYDVPLDWDYLESRLPGIRERVTLLHMPELEIASHQIQAGVHDGRTIRYLVPDEVRRYVEIHGLYAAHGT